MENTNIDIQFNNLNLNDNNICNLCNINNKYNNDMCKNCIIKIKFLYHNTNNRCIYCDFFDTYEYANICYNCNKNKNINIL